MIVTDEQNMYNLIDWKEYNIGHIVLPVSILYSLTKLTTTKFDFCAEEKNCVSLKNTSLQIWKSPERTKSNFCLFKKSSSFGNYDMRDEYVIEMMVSK